MLRVATRSFFIWLGIALGFVGASGATPLDRTIFQLQHTAWTAREGAPGPIFSIAQTADGYLWLGTSAGLYRFDGVRFERYKPLLPDRELSSNDVSALYGAAGGGLWIGYRYGGADFLKDGRIIRYVKASGFPSGTVRRFAADRQGTLWAAAYGQIGRFDGSQWRPIGKEWGYGWDSARDLFVDPKGTLWVANAETIAFLPEGEKQFQHIDAPIDHPARLAQTPDGQGWVLQEPGIDSIPLVRSIVLHEQKGPPSPLTGGLYSSCIFVDHAGNLWITSVDGLLRVSSAELQKTGEGKLAKPLVERFSRENGLTSDTQVSVFEDRERNIWVGTYSGLDRFRKTNVVQAVPQFNTDTASMLLGEKGDLWFAARSGREVVSLRRHEGVINMQRNTIPGYGAASRDAQGETWGGGMHGLWQLANGQFSPVAAAVDAPQKRDVQAILHDRSGNLWVSYVGAGVFLQSKGIWTHEGKLKDLLHATAVSMLEDSTGRIWFGYLGNKLAVYDGSTVRNFTSADGLPVTNIQAIHKHAGHIWVAGERGLALFKEKENRFQEFRVQGELEFRGVSGLVETASGDLWMNTTAGIIRVPVSEVGLAIANPAHRVVCDEFGSADGLLGKARQVRPLPTVLESSDGLLWFLTTGGLVWIDPEHLSRNQLPPSVLVRSVESEGRTYSSPEINMPVGTKNVHIEYTATSLSAPERVQFRYKLEGMDEAWQSGGTRREAFYTNLHPGDYRFRVTASNNDGVWNETGAARSFHIAPAFYQTNWFRFLILALGAGLLWSLYQLRLRTMTVQIDLRYAERLAERTRIARELHDTLLQGFQGLILHFHAATKHLDDPERTKKLMEEALGEADQVLREGRERVRDLRSEGNAPSWLEQELTACGEEFAKSNPVPFKLTVVGSPEPLQPAVGDEIYRIGREALANAFHHSQGSDIEVEVVYTATDLKLRVHDNGRGMGQKMLDAGQPGHWGLSGMRERAQNIRGQLRIWSNSGAGTEVELSIPAKAVYLLKQKSQRSSDRQS